MNAEIISVGNDLLVGEAVNVNAAYLSEKLFEMGFCVKYHSVIPSESVDIIKSLSRAIKRSRLIIFTGGLGGEERDITKETVFKALHIPCEENFTAANEISEKINDGGDEYEIRKLSSFPKNGTVFKNTLGVAYGMAVKSPTQVIVLLPGKTDELKEMFSNEVCKFLEPYSENRVRINTLSLIGVSENTVHRDFSQYIRDGKIAVTRSGGSVKMHIYSKDGTKAFGERIIHQAVKKYGSAVYGIDSNSIEQTVVEMLKKRGMTVAFAESCTGGLAAKRIIDIPGASSVLDMSMVTYSDSVKIKELNVSEETIKKYSVVSKEVVTEMALGIKARSNASIGAAVTGVAGPDSDEYGNPVGLVWISITDGNFVWAKKVDIAPTDMTRERIRENSATALFDFIRRYLLSLPGCLSGGEEVNKDRMISLERTYKKTFENPLSQHDARQIEITETVINDIPEHSQIPADKANDRPKEFSDYAESLPQEQTEQSTSGGSEQAEASEVREKVPDNEKETGQISEEKTEERKTDGLNPEDLEDLFSLKFI